MGKSARSINSVFFVFSVSLVCGNDLFLNYAAFNCTLPNMVHVFLKSTDYFLQISQNQRKIMSLTCYDSLQNFSLSPVY